jgi:F-actin capping protein, beta subunit
MDSAQSILEKTPPSDLEKNLNWFRKLLQDNPDASNALVTKYPIPFYVVEPKCDGERPFLACGYNRNGDNQHRSPWTNTLHPKGEDKDDANLEENEELRLLETTFNEVWDSYKNLYYGHDSVGSVYLKDTEEGAFEGLFCIQKTTSSGSWNSVSFVRANEPGDKECTYIVETSLCLILEPSIGDEVGGCSSKADISLTSSKYVTKACKIQRHKVPLNVSHIEHIGTLIEANEIDLRSNMEKVLIPKNLEIMDTIQKKQEKRPQVNPLMGMVMNSDLLKKRLAKTASGN